MAKPRQQFQRWVNEFFTEQAYYVFKQQKIKIQYRRNLVLLTSPLWSKGLSISIHKFWSTLCYPERKKKVLNFEFSINFEYQGRLIDRIVDIDCCVGKDTKGVFCWFCEDERKYLSSVKLLFLDHIIKPMYFDNILEEKLLNGIDSDWETYAVFRVDRNKIIKDYIRTMNPIYISGIQRKFGIGFQRASKLVEEVREELKIENK